MPGDYSGSKIFLKGTRMIAATGKQRTFLGHPVGLYVLFFTEMWERFSYYGMRALLMLYMLNYFRWSQKDASTTYKLYTSAVYVTPILGGFLADRYLGNKAAVVIGATLMAIGHFLMAFEEYPIFLSALIFLILGNGFFKPNMSTQVGRLYPANDGRRDGAYTIFYMGINLGAFLSPIACGWLADNTVGGYHSGFTLAGIGMVFGLVIYLLGQPLIKELPYESKTPATPAAAPAAHATPAERNEGISAQPLGRPPTPTSDDIPVELHEGITAEPARARTVSAADEVSVAKSPALSEADAARQPSALGILGEISPALLIGVGVLVVVGALFLLVAPLFHVTEGGSWDDLVLLAIGGGCLSLMGMVCAQVRGGVRDRVLAILVLGVFVMFFWAAFEQAGNVLNVWADQSTDRFLTLPAAPPEVIPKVVEDAPKKDGADEAPRAGFFERFVHLFIDMVTLKPGRDDAPEKSWGEKIEGAFNPMPTAWFQSINALAIFLIAPIFAWLWIFLDRRGWQPSIPMKMFLGLVMMSASMAVMMGAARQENRRLTVDWGGKGFPSGIVVTPDNKLAYEIKNGRPQPFHAGRLSWDAGAGKLVMDGVLDANERDRIIGKSAPRSFQDELEKLQKKSKEIDNEKIKSVAVTLTEVPEFDMKYAGLKKSVVQFKDGQLIAHQPLAEKEVKGLLVAAGEPAFRSAVHTLFVLSTEYRVSPWWLFWSYILATLGELCLSPVGLSMVSKLAPAKFATMLMGVWLLTGAFGNYAAGALGELWGTIPPTEFFLLSTVVVAGAAVVLLILVHLVTKTMHGVK
jgi:dipeptide/tripeptide permease